VRRSVNADELLEYFWEWRKRGREVQTLQQDLTMFMGSAKHKYGRKPCVEAYRRAMERQEWDIEQGGRRPGVPRPTPPAPVARPAPTVYVGKKKKGGLVVYPD
jgi:hypothetical protein